MSDIGFTVTAIQGNAVLKGVPGDGFLLRWVAASNQWIATALQDILNLSDYLSDTSGPANVGSNIQLKAQNGQSTTGSGNVGGNGGNVVLTPGAGGSASAAVAGAKGVIYLNGSQRIIISSTRIGNFTIPSGGDYLYSLDPQFGSYTITIPSTATIGDTYIFKDKLGGMNSTHTVTLLPQSGTIDGQSSLVMNSPYQVVKLVYTDTDVWNVI